jgi:hypothetical protein
MSGDETTTTAMKKLERLTVKRDRQVAHLHDLRI